MLTLLKPLFPHRHNHDGSHDSICPICFVTVATVQNEWELASHESAHVCEPENLRRRDAGQIGVTLVPNTFVLHRQDGNKA